MVYGNYRYTAHKSTMKGCGIMPWEVQSEDDDVIVKVYTGGDKDMINRDTGREVYSEFIIQEKGPNGSHTHIGLDENGDEIFRSDR